MYQLVFAGMACICAGALCALMGDLRKQVSLGLVGFLALILVIWGRFFVQMLASHDLAFAAEQFLLSQALATCSYLAMIYFLETAPQPVGEASATRRD